MNWLMTNMNGKACNHDNVYTKTNKRTGKVYAVKLCNPYEGESSVAQTAQRTKFGVMNAAVNAFITAGKAAVAAGTDSDTQVAYLITRQAMERKESRSLHYTIDYPKHALD